MPRWTETPQDQAHIAKINQEMPIGGLVEVRLADGSKIEGVLCRENVGNNAGQGRGGWQYYGECEIHTKDGDRRVIDFLDIKSARSAWTKEKAEEYEQLGLIQIAR